MGKSKQRRKEGENISKLRELIDEMMKFLETSPKPGDNEIRDKFISLDNDWKSYCAEHLFNPSAFILFKREFGKIWWKIYTKDKPRRNGTVSPE